MCCTSSSHTHTPEHLAPNVVEPTFSLRTQNHSPCARPLLPRRQVRRLGLKCALSAKAREGRLILVDSLRPWSPKTKAMSAQLQQLLNRQATAVTALSSAGVTAATAQAQQGGMQEQEVFTPGLLGLPHMVLAQAGGAAAASSSSKVSKAWGRKARRARAMRILSGVRDFRQQEAVLLQQAAAAAAAEPGRAAVLLLLPPSAAQDAGSASPLAWAAAPQAAKQRRRRRQQQQAAARLPVRMSALLLDSSKDGSDGGEWLRRAARNLPGAVCVRFACGWPRPVATSRLAPVLSCTAD
jgi:hypothetical protein